MIWVGIQFVFGVAVGILLLIVGCSLIYRLGLLAKNLWERDESI